ncbi:D-tagatose-bisphosphate aldolase, class II, non-catalytic subunit [Nitrospirillum viridazoti Y2]|uniref:D-tagatose-1,6-bisphosphate aldolase subunit GatZ/KbaZ n=1 Tax=Nitrospirillum amazonense TaxID=28077 RepID=A0A560IB34_9PROT|nr:D-tagatose-bisphosphate aldolase, class II, non-catalytic subunit [Nitrospirillum amazonense]EGY00625.1 D-tagatose-bisphosphate aldolase, class II, non-catalytic subunit [Nitrospirillum amazonense Y2]TWB56226.1 D-tagatose-1,6-bisphosphate aldolase subunit GatZ/KbaZ [Nitrospirillum amazonense]
MKAILDLIERHRAGEPVGIYSVCCAHPLAIKAALRHAREAGGQALIEATSNQVNQEGGYTGLRPDGFRDLVMGLADEAGLPRDRVLLGGDHLGPNAWRAMDAGEAMKRAAVMVADYVTAGFRKIHLDCSMSCGGDPRGLSDAVIAERTATLCERTEAAWKDAGGEPPVYVIGSEVPVPGGAQEALDELAVTDPDAARATIEAHRQAFVRHGLEAAWERVVGLVVQPGVEFDNHHVVDYVPAKAEKLSASIEGQPHLVFEAHSTDYQSAAALAALVRDHFAILKVGPGVTFALREALWALDRIGQEWQGDDRSASLRDTVLAAMRDDPTYWKPYYEGRGAELDLQLQYSLSDRIRYYWPTGRVARAVRRLCAAFDADPPPLALVSQYMPAAYEAIRAGALALKGEDLVIHHIRETLTPYSRACDQRSTH